MDMPERTWRLGRRVARRHGHAGQPSRGLGIATPDAAAEVVLAPMTMRDLPAVVAIEQRVFTAPWSRRVFSDELAERGSRVYRTAWLRSELVGFAGLMLVDDEAHVNTIGVAPEWHGHRIGTVLLADLVRTAVSRGARHLTLEVRVGNEPALALYRRFGMAPVGVRPNYYPEDDADAYVMWAREIDSPSYRRRLEKIEALLGRDGGRRSCERSCDHEGRDVP